MKKAILRKTILFCITIFSVWISPANADIFTAAPGNLVVRGGENIDVLFFPGNYSKDVSDDADDEQIIPMPIEPPLRTMLFHWIYFTPDQVEGTYTSDRLRYYTLPAYTEESVPSEFDNVFINATETSVRVVRPLFGTADLSDVEYIKFRNTPLIPVPYKK